MNIYKGKIWDYCTQRYNDEYRRAVMECLETNKDAKYVDLGCGDGKVTLQYSKRIGTHQVYGVDISEGRLDEADPQRMFLYKERADSELSFGDNYFDVVTANQLIEHVDDTDKLIKEMYRILKPGGYGVISTNNLAASHWIIMFILGINPPTACESDEMCGQMYGEYHGERLHHRLFMLPGLLRVLRFYGFEIEKSVGTYWFPLPIWLARIACRIDKVHASCLVVKVRKPTEDKTC